MKKGKNKRFEDKIALIEDLVQRRKLSDTQGDFLDTVARVESGMLSFADVLEQMLHA